MGGWLLAAAAVVLCASGALAGLDPGEFYAVQWDSTAAAPGGIGQVWYGDVLVLAIAADGGGLSAYERALRIVENRLVPRAQAGELAGGKSLHVGRLNGEAVVYVDNQAPLAPSADNVLVTVDAATAAYFGTQPRWLAELWAYRLAKVIYDARAVAAEQASQGQVFFYAPDDGGGDTEVAGGPVDLGPPPPEEPGPGYDDPTVIGEGLLNTAIDAIEIMGGWSSVWDEINE